MNTKICALLFSCLFFNATMLSMMPEQERDNLSCKQIGISMIPIGAGCTLLATIIMSTPNNVDLEAEDIAFISTICASFAACGVWRCRYSFRKQNRAAAHENERLEHERYHRENPSISIAQEIEKLQADLSQEETLELILAARFKERWQKIQEDFSANEALYQDDQVKVKHKATLAEIDAEIHQKFFMGLQPNVKSAAKS